MVFIHEVNMNARILFAIALGASAMVVNAQEPAPVNMPTVPPHNCVKPELPGANANNARMRQFNDSYKAYGECIRKYIEGAKALADSALAGRTGERLCTSLKMRLVIACTGLVLYDLHLLVAGLG